MATWEDLDSEFGSEKEEAEEEANVAMGLVATVTSEAELDLVLKTKMRYMLNFPKS